MILSQLSPDDFVLCIELFRAYFHGANWFPVLIMDMLTIARAPRYHSDNILGYRLGFSCSLNACLIADAAIGTTFLADRGSRGSRTFAIILFLCGLLLVISFGDSC